MSLEKITESDSYYNDLEYKSTEEIIKIISKLFLFLDSPDDEVIIDEHENSQEMQPLSPTTPPPT